MIVSLTNVSIFINYSVTSKKHNVNTNTTLNPLHEKHSTVCTVN